MKSHFYVHRLAIVSATLIAVLFFSPRIHAQSQDQDLQQMKEKLEKLEQEMQDLKGQINKAQAQPAPAATGTKTTVTARATEEADETPAAAEPKKQNTVDIYKHVMLDAGYEFSQSNSS